MLAAAFTLLPALLSLLGERAFWPARSSKPAVRCDDRGPRDAGTGSPALVRRRSRTIIVLVSAGLARARARQPQPTTARSASARARPSRPTPAAAPRSSNEHFPPGHRLAADRGRQRPRTPGRVAEGWKSSTAVKLALPVPPTQRQRRDRRRRRPPRQPLLGRGRGRGRGDPRPPARDRARRPARRHPGRELRHRADQRRATRS